MTSGERLRSICLVLCLLAPALVSCTTSTSDEQGGEPLPADVTWRTLISGEWSLAGGSEGYTCVRQTIDEDLFISSFEAINPLGTHHTLLTMGAPNEPDGLSPCNAGTNHQLSVFGSGVGTNPLDFPPGVALKIAKGTQLLLNLHLFNTGAQELSGSSGTRARTMPESDVVSIAEGIIAGTVLLDIPPLETAVHTGYCTMSSDVSVFAVAPHMHQLGIYERVFAESSVAGEVVLYDGPYDFNEQSYYPIDPVKFLRGDRMRVECTHRNTTDKTVGFGDSSLAEMCFAGFYRYPADGSPFACVDRQ